MSATVLMLNREKILVEDGPPAVILTNCSAENIDKITENSDNASSELGFWQSTRLTHKDFMSPFRRMLIKLLNKVEFGVGDEFRRVLEEKPALARAFDALHLSPDAILSPTLEGVERQLIDRASLPELAPVLWAEAKQPGDTPPDFIQRHYTPWLGKGLTVADLLRLDPKLHRALYNWKQRHPLPEGFVLPTLKELNDAQVQEAFADGNAAHALPADPKAARRIANAYAYRTNRGQARE